MSDYVNFLHEYKGANPGSKTLVESVAQIYTACFEADNRDKIAREISKVVQPEIDGKVFTDQYWEGKDIVCSRIADRFPDADIQLNTTDDGFGYQAVDSTDGMPNFKKWRADITVGGVSLHGCITAEAIGGQEDPFGKYRILFYIS